MVKRRENDRRIDQLEKLFEASTDERYAPIDPDLLAIIAEYSAMKSAMAEHMSIGGKKIEPRNPAAEFYGRPYTQREFRELAIARALEKCGYSTAEIEERMEEHLALFEEGGHDEHIGAVD